MKFSNIIQFILGFLIGVLLLAGGTALAAYYFLNKMNTTPSRPIYSEEKKEEQKVTSKTVSETKETPQAKEEPKAPPEPPKPSPKKQEEKEKEKEKEKLEPGAYKARVTWSSGLSLRDEPSRDSNRIGGVGYNAELIIIKESEDKEWQKVRISDTGQEGWVKSGNVRKIDE